VISASTSPVADIRSGRFAFRGGPTGGRPPPPFFLQMFILKGFKSNVLEVSFQRACRHVSGSADSKGVRERRRFPSGVLRSYETRFPPPHHQVSRHKSSRVHGSKTLGPPEADSWLTPYTLMPKAIRLLPISEAAAAMGCSYRTVMRGIKAGRIARTRRSRRAFVSEREVAKYAKPAYRPSRHQPDIKSQVKTARWYQSQGGSDQKVKRPPIVGAALLLEI
jgi:hypothetical protein